MRKISLIAAAVAVLMLFASCSSNKPIARHEPDKDAETYEIKGSLTVENDDELTVVFENNLLKGTIVEVAVYTYDGRKLYSDRYSVSGPTVKVEIEKNSDWTGEKAYVSVVASPSSGRQSADIREAYGRLFQNVLSDNLIWDKDENILLFQSEEITL